VDFFISDNWWEPASVGFDVGDATAILVFIITAAAVIRSTMKWWMKQFRSIIKEEVNAATTLIHPNANGGLSLPDVARKVDSLEKTIDHIRLETLELKDLIVSYIIKKETTKAKRRVNKTA
jgi:hypothetical protein